MCCVRDGPGGDGMRCDAEPEGADEPTSAFEDAGFMPGLATP